MPISIEEIQAQLPELALRLRGGSEVIITKEGRPYVTLVAHPMPPAKPRNLDAYKGAMSDEAVDALLAPFTKEEVLKLFWDGKTE